jgi:uncharacterized protein
MELDCETLDALAAQISHGISGSRLHGALVAAICTDAPGSPVVQPILAASLQTALASGPGLSAALQQVEDALSDPEFSFEPLLPDESGPLASRAEALADWCDAFVMGMVAAAPGDSSAEREELLTDLSAIAGGLEPGTLEDGSDEDEEDFMQILEFVRVAALSLFSERCPGSELSVH